MQLVLFLYKSLKALLSFLFNLNKENTGLTYEKRYRYMIKHRMRKCASYQWFQFLRFIIKFLIERLQRFNLTVLASRFPCMVGQHCHGTVLGVGIEEGWLQRYPHHKYCETWSCPHLQYCIYCQMKAQLDMAFLSLLYCVGVIAKVSVRYTILD